MVEQQTLICQYRPDGQTEPLSPATQVARRKADARPDPRCSLRETTAIVTATAAESPREPLVSAPRRLRDEAPPRDVNDAVCRSPNATADFVGRRLLVGPLLPTRDRESLVPNVRDYIARKPAVPAYGGSKAMLQFVRVKLNERVVL